MSNNAVIERYVALRDQLKGLEKAHDEATAPIKDALKKIEVFLLNDLNKQGLDSMKSKSGTAFKTKVVSVTLADKPLYLQFIKDNDLWELLDVRPLKTAVVEYKAEMDDLPPGLNYREEFTVNVRRPA